jgi:hypothetical protein
VSEREAELVDRLDKLEQAAVKVLDRIDRITFPSMDFGTARDLVEAVENMRSLAVGKPRR